MKSTGSAEKYMRKREIVNGLFITSIRHSNFQKVFENSQRVIKTWEIFILEKKNF